MPKPSDSQTSEVTVHPVRRRLSYHWNLFCWALVLVAGTGIVVLIFAPNYAGLFLFGLYAIPSNSMVPVPHEPGLLYFARYYHPLYIATAGTLGTAAAAFADYEVVERMLRHPRIEGMRDTAVYQFAVRWLMRWPFATIVLFSFTPLPIYVVRVLAPASGYPVWRYVVALMVGRWPRFLLVAWFGYTFPLPNWALIAMFFLLLALVFAAGRGAGGGENCDASGTAEPDRTQPPTGNE